jgi:hypothetical protein
MSDSPTLLQTMAAAVDLHERHQRIKARPAKDAVPDAIPMGKQRATLPMTNNNEAPAPPLTLMKRVDTEQEDQPMGNKFSTLLKSAVTNLERGNLDVAERALAEAERMQKRSVVHNHFYGDNGDDGNDIGDNGTVEDTWSEAADAKTKYNNASAKKAAADDEPDDEDDLEDEDEFDKRRIRKASYHHDILGGAETLPEPRGTPMRSGDRSDSYQLSVTPATRAASPHKFDRLVEHVQERDSCSKNNAMATARREYPDAYESYQEFVAGSPTNEQATRRAGRGVGKRMPNTFEDLVAAEMRKGVSWRTAEQRVINVHGSTALNRRMVKRVHSVGAEFSKRATAIMWEDGVDRTEALRRLRKEQPWLYDALNSS